MLVIGEMQINEIESSDKVMQSTHCVSHAESNGQIVRLKVCNIASVHTGEQV